MIPQFQGVDLLLLEPSKLEFMPDSESKRWVKITVRITHTTHHNDEVLCTVGIFCIDGSTVTAKLTSLTQTRLNT